MATIPLTVITGFLGSGKTTLLRHALADSALAGTAVIINEFGTIGLDHDLIESAEEDLVALTTGCLCCAVRGDLTRTISELLGRREKGEIQFERLMVETSGLADPAPIVQGLALDDDLRGLVSLERMVVTLDAVNGPAVLGEYREAQKQIAFADAVIVTKTDLADAAPAIDAASTLNPRTTFTASASGRIDTSLLLPPPDANASLARWLELAGNGEAEHTEGISSISLVRSEPVQAIALTLFLEALAEACGPDLLRVKGLVQIAEAPETPAVVHGVQHVFHPLDWLERWPSADRRTRLVLIGRNLLPGWPRLLLNEIEREVHAAED